jgi:hypothetical protein
MEGLRLFVYVDLPHIYYTKVYVNLPHKFIAFSRWLRRPA